jgi:hypothetical protein
MTSERETREYQRLALDLIALAERLDRFSQLTPGTAALLSLEDQRTFERWRSLFSDEIQFVRSTRNSVAHAKTVPLETLTKAVATGKRLLDLVESQIDAVDLDEAYDDLELAEERYLKTLREASEAQRLYDELVGHTQPLNAGEPTPTLPPEAAKATGELVDKWRTYQRARDHYWQLRQRLGT